MLCTLWLMLLQMFVHFTTSVDLIYNHTCYRNTDKLICDIDLPEPSEITEDVTKVYVQAYQWNNLNTRRHIFRHERWQVIQELSIKKDHGNFVLSDNVFIDLSKLEILKIHSIVLSRIEEQSFAGLHYLRILDLSNCTALNSMYVVEALRSSNSTFKLDVLCLDFMGYIGNDIITYGYNFSRMMNQREVKSLSIHGTNILFKDIKSLYNIPFFLEYIDFSNCNLYIFKDSRFLSYNMPRIYPESVNRVKFVNVSGAKAINKMPDNDRGVFCDIKPALIHSLEIIDVSKLIKTRWIYTEILDISCFINLKKVFASSNHIYVINATVIWPLQMEEVDISSNEMEYISPKVFDGLVPLKQLHLSNNCLYKMERLVEFQHLFSSLTSLVYLNLCNNSLTTLPVTMFAMNTELRVLILKENNLKSVYFIPKNLNKITILDLQNNSIEKIGKNELQIFYALIDKENKTIRKGLELNLLSNKFECICDNLDFLKFIFNDLKPMTNQTYACLLEGKMVKIDSTTLDNTSYLCYRHIILITLIILSVIISLVSGSIVYLVWKKRRTINRQNVVKHFLQQILIGHCQERYLVFISNSSADTEYIIDVLEPAVKDHLAKNFNIPRRFIVTGDGAFSYGYPILNEIMRCIKLSSVMVCFISKSYCESDWCQTELRECVQQQKPILLLLREDIDRENMSEILLNQFDRNARAKLELNDGIYVPVGGWDHFCESIVNLASNKYNCDEQNAKRKQKVETRNRGKQERRNQEKQQIEEETAFI